MPPPITQPFGDWRPDAADLNSGFCSVAKNVLPHPSGYKQMPGVSTDKAILPSTARGAAFASNYALPNPLVPFAGTFTQLLRASSILAFADVTRLVGGAYACGLAAPWYFAQYGTQMIAVNPVDDPQVYSDVSIVTNFAALGGSPPKATGVSISGEHVVLWGLATNKRKLRWGGIGSSTSWTVGVGLCDEQEFPDLGNITGWYGDESGYVLQQWGVRAFQHLPGDITTIFQFSKVPGAQGCISAYGWAAAPNGNIYYVSTEGFHVIGPGGYRNLSDNKISIWFRDEAHGGTLEYVQCTIDPVRPIVMWAFHNTNDAADPYDRVVMYDYSLDRFSHGDMQCESLLKYAFGAAAPWEPSSDIDGMFIIKPTTHALAYLNTASGGSVTSTLTLAEMEMFPGRRAFVDAVSPVVSIGELDNIDISDAYRDTMEGSPTTATTTTAETTGKFSFTVSARLHKFTAIITATAAQWTGRAQALRIFAQPDGEA